MKNIFSLVIIICLSMLSLNSNAQFGILKKVGKETERKIKKGAEDIIVKKTSDELARRALKPLDSAFDNAFRASYRKQYGEDYTDEQIDSIITADQVNYSNFMASFDKYDQLPASYHFDVIMEVETKDYDKSKVEMTLYHSTNNAIFGMKQKEDGQEQLVVLDNDRELAAIYTEEKGEKKVQAVSTTMFTDMAAHGAQQSSSQVMEDFTVKRTGKTKKILGFESYEIEGETKDESFEAYFSDKVPVDWTKTFGPFMQKVAPKSFNDSYSDLKGVMLENETKRKEDGKKSTWKTKKIKLDQNFQIDNSEYKSGLQSQ